MHAKDEQLKLHKTPGGIPVIVDRLSYSRSAGVAVYVGIGSRDEPHEKCGIAHLLEHLLFKGTSNRTSKAISQAVEAAGGEMNGYTGKEVTCYFIHTIDETLGTAEELLADIMKNPLLAKKDVETEKKVVMQEIKMAEDDPDNYIHDLMAKSIWAGNPMASPESGSVECILPLSSRDVRSYYEDNYRPPHLTVVASGNVDVGQVVDWAGASFDDLPRSGRGLERRPPRFHPGIQVFPREGDQTYAALGFPGVPVSHPDRFVQNMLSVILGAGTSSRLYQKVREENGLVYSIYAITHSFTDTGAFGIYFSTSSENSERVLKLVASELRGLKRDGLEADELSRAKRWLKGMVVRKLEPMETRMFFLGEQFLQTGKLLTEDQILKKVDAVTERQLMETAQGMLRPGKMCAALHMPKGEGARISRVVESMDF
ncbi:MAG TPA: pitrilysin family protein [Methanomassiliicoccales archaeon]|nr:pitrilysin family protein [Methanomassiliicoccales archaeon]